MEEYEWKNEWFDLRNLSCFSQTENVASSSNHCRSEGMNDCILPSSSPYRFCASCRYLLLSQSLRAWCLLSDPRVQAKDYSFSIFLFPDASWLAWLDSILLLCFSLSPSCFCFSSSSSVTPLLGSFVFVLECVIQSFLYRQHLCLTPTALFFLLSLPFSPFLISLSPSQSFSSFCSFFPVWFSAQQLLISLFLCCIVCQSSFQPCWSVSWSLCLPSSRLCVSVYISLVWARRHFLFVCVNFA